MKKTAAKAVKKMTKLEKVVKDTGKENSIGLSQRDLQSLFHWNVKQRVWIQDMITIVYNPIILCEETQYYRQERFSIRKIQSKVTRVTFYEVFYEVMYGNIVVGNDGIPFQHQVRSFPWTREFETAECAVNFSLQLQGFLDTIMRWDRMKNRIDPNSLQFIKDMNDPTIPLPEMSGDV